MWVCGCVCVWCEVEGVCVVWAVSVCMCEGESVHTYMYVCECRVSKSCRYFVRV